ncbi:hypothetical protein PMAYCL1PPCAC_06891, partial [Pristionchus mayeri]
PDKGDYPLYEDLLLPEPSKFEETTEELPTKFPLAIQPGEKVCFHSTDTLDVLEMYKMKMERMMKEVESTHHPTTTQFPLTEEFVIGPGGVPISRVTNITHCSCSPTVYNQFWCPYGIAKDECEREYLTLPSDSDSVFFLSSSNCSLQFECSSGYSLYGNVFLPLGVFPEPSNIEKEIQTAERNGFSTAFECSREGNFELVFVSPRRRVVFVIHDLA